MFFLQCNDGFVLKKINELCIQYNMATTLDETEIFYAVIDLKLEESSFIINFEKKKIILNRPTSANNLIKTIILMLSSYFQILNNSKYFPNIQLFEYNNKKLHLGHIQNTIFSNLILNLENGIDKNKLYKIIWPHDKNIQLNKLDTHLTNLKNELFRSTSFELSFGSTKGKLKLFI